MDSGRPRAIIVGDGGELEEKLTERLIRNEIVVEKFGDGVEGREYKYVFVFPGENGWEKIGWGKEVKITLIETEWDGGAGNMFDQLVYREGVRQVTIMNLYGPGVDDEWWGKRVMELAAANNNLELPSGETMSRWLFVTDAVEAILRATILSDIGEGRLEVWGERMEVSRLAGELMEKAQMTKYKVKQMEIEVREADDEVVEGQWERIRWRPETSLEEGLAETMQYFVSRWDELSRMKTETTAILPARAKKDPGYGLVVEVEEGGGAETPKNEEKYKSLFEVDPGEGKTDENGGEERQEKESELKGGEPGVDVQANESGREGVGYWTKAKADELVYESEWLNQKRKKVEEQLAEDDAEEEIREEERGETVESPKYKDVYPEQAVAVGQTETIKEKTKAEESIKNSGGRRRGWWKVGIPKISKDWGGVLKRGWIYWVVIVIGGGWLVGSLIGWLGPMAGLAKGLERGIKEGGWSDKELEKIEIDKKKLTQKLNQWGNSWWAQTQWGRRYGEVGAVLAEAAGAIQSAQLIAKSSENIIDAVWGEKEIDWGEEVDKMQINWEGWQEGSGKLLARLRGDWRWLPEGWEEKRAAVVEQLTVKRKTTEKMGRLLEVMPAMVAADGGRKEYLVLFQNEAELRPTGGFIGSWALVSFEAGRLVNFEVRDVYEGDGQLKGHVEPPEPIKTHLGEAGWFLRDANWNPDFRKSATDIGWFLEKETGRVVDGVIGVDLAVAKEILEVVGDLKLPGFDTKINGKNLYEQAQFYAENKFFPGSKQKANFLGELGNQLFEEIKTLKGSKKWQVGEKMISLAEKREIQIWLREAKEAAVMGELGWDGAIFGGECKNERCLADYLMPVDANLGVNKANFFVKRKVEMGVEIGNNLVARVVRINWENTSRSSSWPGGDYKNYLRIYVPTGVNLGSVVLSDGRTGAIVKTYSPGELKIESSSGKTVIGLLVMVPIASSRILEVRYNSSVNLGAGDNFSYLMYGQKQSGWGDTGLAAVVNMPPGWQPLQAEPAATSVGQKLLFNLRWDRDIKLGVEMGK